MIELINEEYDALDIDHLRKKYKTGVNIVLDYMDDTQAPPPGTKGTVDYVDDAGQVHVKWDTGSSLAIIPGLDEFHIEPVAELPADVADIAVVE